MSEHEVVKVASGPLVQIELWQQTLTEAGIKSQVVGTDLSAGLGSLLPASVELWVNVDDEPAAQAAIQLAERKKGHSHHPSDAPHGIPESDRPHKGPEGDHAPGGTKFNTGPRGK